jgi:hypothetical protein
VKAPEEFDDLTDREFRKGSATVEKGDLEAA